MSRRERRRFLSPDHRGLVLSPTDRLSLRESFKNLALVAPTGSGKTSKYVIPNLLDVQGSVVVTDPAGEIFAQTSGHLAERNFRLQVLRFGEVERSLRFNPLHYWQSPQKLRQLATILAFNHAGAQSDLFWATSASNVLFFCLSALVNVPDKRFVNLANLRWLLNHLGAARETGVNSFMSRYLEAHDPRMFAEYLAFQAQDPRLLGSILSSARASLELWSDPDVCQVTATDSVRLEGLRERFTAIYLIVPEHQIRYFSVLLNLFYSTCFAHCLDAPLHDDLLPVFFFLDEFGNLGRIENFASIITTLRKRRCSVSVVLQELSQLEAVYGSADARTIFSGGCAHKLFLGGLDVETTQYLERALGQSTEYDTTFGGVDERARTLGVPLLRSDEIRMLQDDEGVLLSGRERPVKLRMLAHFRHQPWQLLAQKPPAPFPHGEKTPVVLFPLRSQSTEAR